MVQSRYLVHMLAILFLLLGCPSDDADDVSGDDDTGDDDVSGAYDPATSPGLDCDDRDATCTREVAVDVGAERTEAALVASVEQGEGHEGVRLRLRAEGGRSCQPRDARVEWVAPRGHPVAPRVQDRGMRSRPLRQWQG